MAEGNLSNLPALCKRLRLSAQHPWNVEYISLKHRQDKSLSQKKQPIFPQPLNSSTQSLPSTRWSRGSRGTLLIYGFVFSPSNLRNSVWFAMCFQTGLLDSEESKRKPIAVQPPGDAFAVSWLQGRFIGFQYRLRYLPAYHTQFPCAIA